MQWKEQEDERFNVFTNHTHCVDEGLVREVQWYELLPAVVVLIARSNSNLELVCSCVGGSGFGYLPTSLFLMVRADSCGGWVVQFFYGN